MDLPNDMKLELVQVLFRHGSRVFYKAEADVLNPADVDHTLAEEYGYEQLTKLGKNQAYNLGRVLRERYDKFLGSGYRPEEVYAYSSNVDRTKMSLQLVLAGLFSPNDEQKWHPELKWIPIPFHCAPIEFDVLLRGNDKPKYKQLWREVIMNTPEIRNEYSELREFIELLDKKGVFAEKQGTYPGVHQVHNVLTIQKSENRKQPDWYSDDLLKKLRHYFVLYLHSMSYTTELKKLFAGALIKKFIENLNVNDEVHNPRKIYLYSGHELNIAAVLKSLEIKDFGYPDFSSAIVMEKLRDSRGRLYVRYLGWTGKDDKFITLKIENCDEICHIDDFLNYTKDIIPSDEEIKKMYEDTNIDVRRAFATDFVYKHKY